MASSGDSSPSRPSRAPIWPLEELLPHRPPFLLIDRLLRYGDDVAEAQLAVRDDLGLPESGLLSPFLVVEALAQTAAAHAGALTREREQAEGAAAERHEGALVRMDHMHVTGEVQRGDMLRLRVTLDRAMGALRRYQAQATVDGEVRLEAVLTFATTPVHV